MCVDPTDRMQLCCGQCPTYPFLIRSLNNGLQQQPYFWPTMDSPFDQRLASKIDASIGQHIKPWDKHQCNFGDMWEKLPQVDWCFFLTTFVHHCASTLQGLYLVYMADSFGPLSDWSALIHNCQTSIFVEPGMLGLAVWSKFSLPWDLFPCYVTWPTWPPFEVANKRGSRIWRTHQIL